MNERYERKGYRVVSNPERDCSGNKQNVSKNESNIMMLRRDVLHSNHGIRTGFKYMGASTYPADSYIASLIFQCPMKI